MKIPTKHKSFFPVVIGLDLVWDTKDFGVGILSARKAIQKQVLKELRAVCKELYCVKKATVKTLTICKGQKEA